MDHAKQADPLVPVCKGDGFVRLCGDYKVTVNPCLQVHQYRLPKQSDLMASLTGGESFSKLNLISSVAG